jgi:hypothetical protein
MPSDLRMVKRLATLLIFLAALPLGASASAATAKILRTGESMPFAWKDGTLTLAFPEPAKDQPHEVIALETSRSFP